MCLEVPSFHYAEIAYSEHIAKMTQNYDHERMRFMKNPAGKMQNHCSALQLQTH